MAIVVVLLTVVVLAPPFIRSVESASVKITVPATRVEAQATVHGSPSGGQFKTERVSVSDSKSGQASATGVATTPARYATGYVVFNHVCGPQPLPGSPCQATPPVQAGKVVWNDQGTMTYVLLATISCFCGERVPVRASSAGTIGNAPAHSITLYVALGFTPFEYADNPAPIAGGANASSQRVIAQADLDTMRDSLISQVTTNLNAKLAASDPGTEEIVDSSATIQTSSDNGVGAASDSFRVTVSGSLGATRFSLADADASIASALSDKIADGYELIGLPTITGYQVEDSNPQGDVTISGTAVGYMIRKISVDSLRAKLRGLDTSAAARTIHDTAPGSVIDIHQAPLPIPWLPTNADRISIDVIPAYR